MLAPCCIIYSRHAMASAFPATLLATEFVNRAKSTATEYARCVHTVLYNGASWGKNQSEHTAENFQENIYNMLA
jgi:hypothetical protein